MFFSQVLKVDDLKGLSHRKINNRFPGNLLIIEFYRYKLMLI